MTRIVVLGSNGFLGTELHETLSKNNFHAHYMIHKKIKELKNNQFYGDILESKTLFKNLNDNDIVVNLVGQYSKNDSEFINSNLTGSLNLLNIAKEKKLKIIYASSLNVYGESCKYPSKEKDLPNPITKYGLIKLLTEKLYEQYSKLYNIDVTIIRFGNIYGKKKKSGIIYNILNSTKKNPVTLTNNGNQFRDFLHIDDAVSGLIRTIEVPPKNYQIYNLCSQEKISSKQIIKFIESYLQKKIPFIIQDNKIDEKCIWGDNSKFQNHYDFLPKISFKKGLHESIFEK